MFVENLTETIELGRKFAQGLNPQSIVLLQGPIGAGKTSFVQGIAKGLSISEDITSPTFALSNHYNSGTIPLIHIDLYRLENRLIAKEFFISEEEEANQTESIKLLTSLSLINFCRISFCVSTSFIECNQGSKPIVIFFFTFFFNQENGEFLVMFSIVKKDWLTSCRI